MWRLYLHHNVWYTGHKKGKSIMREMRNVKYFLCSASRVKICKCSLSLTWEQYLRILSVNLGQSRSPHPLQRPPIKSEPGSLQASLQPKLSGLIRGAAERRAVTPPAVCWETGGAVLLLFCHVSSDQINGGEVWGLILQLGLKPNHSPNTLLSISSLGILA